jgi:hypothetical protein
VAAFLSALRRIGLTWHGGSGWTGPFAVGYFLDPVAGRAVAGIAGRPMLAAWAVALAADMLYFVTTAVPTLWIDWATGSWPLALGAAIGLTVVLPEAWRRMRRPAAAVYTDRP